MWVSFQNSLKKFCGFTCQNHNNEARCSRGFWMNFVHLGSLTYTQFTYMGVFVFHFHRNAAGMPSRALGLSSHNAFFSVFYDMLRIDLE